MPKYTKEFKIKLVLEYLSGESGGSRSVSKKYGIPKNTLREWIIKYKSGGFDNLSKKSKNNNYTSEFKLSVIQYRQINNTNAKVNHSSAGAKYIYSIYINIGTTKEEFISPISDLNPKIRNTDGGVFVCQNTQKNLK